MLAVLGELPDARLLQRPVAPGFEVEECARIQSASNLNSGATSLALLQKLQCEAGPYFLGTFDQAAGDTLIGFVAGRRLNRRDGTLSPTDTHLIEGSCLHVQSVFTRTDMRGKGVALLMLKSYIRAVAKEARGVQTSPSECVVVVESPFVRLFHKAGFQLVGPCLSMNSEGARFELCIDNLARFVVAEELLQFDSFASFPGTGNPGALVFTQRNGDEAWMQSVALENNLAETAFVERLSDTEYTGKDKASVFSLRWFTPNYEVDLCGHATLGAAHGLWESGRADKHRPIAFQTRVSGVLTCTLAPAGWIQMDFPADPPVMSDGESDPLQVLPKTRELACAIGIAEASVLAVGRGRFDIMCEVTPEAFDALAPNQAVIATFATRGLVATTAGCRGSRDGERAEGPAEGAVVDFRSRFFRRVGTLEDPVTGSAHCMLAPYWAKRLSRSGDGSSVVGFQASARGGAVRCQLTGGGCRVVISGRVVTSMKGTLHCG